MTGAFKNFFIISFLIIIHELGHFLVAKILKIEVDKIYLYPLGGVSKLNMPLNTSCLKEFIILIAGPLFQIIASFILIEIIKFDKNLVLLYHNGILLFNLLPIYPLDGGKIINIFLNNFIPYKLSLRLCIYLSYFLILVFILFQRNITINILVMVIMLIVLTTKERRKISFIYNKFLLERYLNNYHFQKSKLISNYDDFYRNRRHIIHENEKYYLESDYLAQKMKKNIEKR